MKKILVIDNYDSFTYNLVQYLEKISGEEPAVFRNDAISLEDVGEYDKILLSPGPGVPHEAGICLDLINRYAASKSILGVCLGHQAIGEAFGAELINLPSVYHGMAMPVQVTDKGDPLFRNMPGSFIAGRYHSWVVGRNNFPDGLKITCTDENNLVMAISHKEYDVRGVQFHPESVLTENGNEIIRNWLEI